MNKYKELRNRYLPKEIKTIFILESPPSGGGYFYNPEGRTSEILFRSIMKAVLKITPKNKDEGLKEFAKKGYILVDPIYEPVDKLSDKEADRLILENYSNFIQDLNDLIKNNKEIKIILVKKTILTLLENKMLLDGFNVVNKGLAIPFPMHYHYSVFEERLQKLLQD